MTGILSNMTSKKMDLKITLVYVINNCHLHFYVNEATLNNGKSIHKYTTKNVQNNTSVWLLILLLKYFEDSRSSFTHSHPILLSTL